MIKAEIDEGATLEKRRGRGKGDNLKQGTLKTAGKALPSFPTTAEELAAQWGVGTEDTYSVIVKVTRPAGGTVELLADVPLRAYDAGALAGQFGPGLYYLRASSGKYAKHGSKMIFSEEYARSNGFGTIAPAPMTARDQMAMETLQRATEGPTRPQDLAAAIEQIMDRRDADRMRGAGGQQLSNVLPVQLDPMAHMQAQMQNTIQMMEMFRGLEERAIKTVEMRMGIKQPEDMELETNGSLMEKLLLKGLDVVQAFMTMPKPGQVAAPIVQNQPAQVQPAQPSQPVPALEEKTPMPNLTPEEQNAIGSAVSMLRPYAGTLMQLVASGLTDEQIVEELDPWIPAPMAGPLAALADAVAKHGPGVLWAIHAGLVSERWASILPKLVAALQ